MSPPPLNRHGIVWPGVAVVLFAVVYHERLLALVQTWASDADYGHGFFILPIAAWLAWRRRNDLAPGDRAGGLFGYAVAALWVIVYAAGSIGRIVTLVHLSMALYPVACAAMISGPRAASAMVVPSGFILFMFPVPSELYTRLTNPLLLVSTTASFSILHTIGIPVFREGNILTLPGYTMEVVQACSGIRSLVTIMALAYLMAVLMVEGRVRSIILFLLSIPTAIVGNILRITVTALLAYSVSPAAAQGFSHTVAGLATFALSFVILYGCMELIRWISPPARPSPSA